MEVIDNVLPEEMFNSLLQSYHNPSMNYGWKSNQTTDPHGHWNLSMGRITETKNLADIYGDLDPHMKIIWDTLKMRIPHIQLNVLIRCYMNGGTYGVEGYYHTDSDRVDETTIVIYLTNEWKLDWGGETNLVMGGEIVKSVIPKRNRAFLFDSHMLHCARGVTRTCYELRKTLMFKSRKPRSATFETLSRFLRSHNATAHKHMKGSLHDHLMRVYQILETQNFPEHVCVAGGLHSVFGTNYFKSMVFDVNNTVFLESKFGKQAVELAKLFCSLNRPHTLEHAEETVQGVQVQDRSLNLICISPETFNDLRTMECANLLDQSCLDPGKYPGLVQFWTDKTTLT